MTAEKSSPDDPRGVKLLRSLRGHTHAVEAVAWSPDGKILSTASHGDTIRLWNAHTGESLRIIELDLQVWAVAFSPGALVSGSGDGALRLWDAASGNLRHTLKGHTGAVWSVACDANGHTIASGSSDQTVKLWEAASGQLLHTLKGHSCGVNSVAFDPAGRILATGDDEGFVRLWNVSDGRLLHILATGVGHISCVAFDPQGETLACAGGSGTVEVREIDSGRLIRSLEGHTGIIRSLAYSSVHPLVATASLDGTLRLWIASAGLELARIQEASHGEILPGLAFHPHLPWFATVGFDSVASTGLANSVVHIWEYDPAILLGQTKSFSVTYTSAKIVLVGDSGVGKTGLGWRLKHGEFKEHPSTHGQQFWLLDQFATQRTDGTQCEAILWDLAGQPDYRLIHALFLDDADLALVLFDPTRNDDPLQGVEFWLQQLKDCPKLLVAARADRGTPRLTTEEIEDFCRRRGLSAYLCTSALRGEGVAELLHRAQALIPWDTKPATVTTETFKRIKDHVLALKESPQRDKVVLTPAELRARLLATDSAWDFTDAEMLTAVGHLANHGYVTKLKTSQGEQRILLAPELLNNLAASFVLEARRQQKGLGSLEEQRLLAGQYAFPELEKFDPAERDILLDSAVVLFLQHNVCFREIDPLTAQTYLIFPELINLKRPVAEDDKPLEDGISYTVTGSVKNVYASLVVLLGYTHTFTRTSQWKNQARYKFGNGFVCGFRQEAEQEGEIQFVLSYGVDVSALIRTHFQNLFENFLDRRNLTIFRYEPVACTKGHPIHRAVVREELAAGSDFAFCARCGERVALPKADRPIPLTPSQAAEVEAQRLAAAQRSRFEQALFRWKSYITEQQFSIPDCFISYARGNAEHERWVEHSLASDLLKAGVKVVLDRWENGRFAASVPRFVERAAKSDRVIVVGTPLYRTKYENGDPMHPYVVAAEGDLIGARMLGTEASKETVIPVLLEGTPQDSFPVILNGRVYADFRKVETYFDTAFELILCLYRISHLDPVAAELRSHFIAR